MRVKNLIFPDGSKVGITGLDVVMEEMYHQGKPANIDTASEIIKKLEGPNYFAPSELNIYKYVLLGEYQRFLEEKSPHT
jgi:hypothetical protein